MPKRDKQNPYQNTGETTSPLIKTMNTLKGRNAQIEAAVSGKPKKRKRTPIYEFDY